MPGQVLISLQISKFRELLLILNVCGITLISPYVGFTATVLQYQGPFFYGSPGVSTEGIGGIGTGFMVSTSPDFSLTSVSWYVGASLSADPLPVWDWDMGYLYYVPGYHYRSYVDELSGKVNLSLLINDISKGDSSPWPLSIPLHGDPSRFLGVEKAVSYAWVYNEIHAQESQ